MGKISLQVFFFFPAFIALKQIVEVRKKILIREANTTTVTRDQIV
jgi:hypothetical protein